MSHDTDDLAFERDLRRALLSVAPEDVDATSFRTRFDRVLAAQTHPAVVEPPATAAGDVLPLHPAHHPRRSRTSRAALVATVVACAAAVIAILVAIVPAGHSERRPPPPASSPTAPASIRSLLLPGTIVLHTYTGHGSRTFPVEHRVPPAHFGYSAYGTCAGGGVFTINRQELFNECSRNMDRSAFGTGITIVNELVIKARKTATWQITLVLVPDTRTNASLQQPTDVNMTGPDSGVRQSGTGSRSVTFRGATPRPVAGTRYRVSLVCHGAGVALPELTSPQANGLRTRTCFDDYQYNWLDVRLTPPTAVRVVAAPGTTWTIAIDPLS